MSRLDQLALTACGCLTSVGLSYKQTCSSIRAGITRFNEHGYYDCLGPDPEWDDEEPLTSSAVATIDPFLDGPERLFSLAIPPLKELIANSKLNRDDLGRTAFLLALPQEEPALVNWPLDNRFATELLGRTGMAAVSHSETDRGGHTGIFSLIQRARVLIDSKKVDFCILGGVDSYLLEERLDYLDEQRRIKSERNLDGYIPGEAGCMLLLERPDQATERGLSPLAFIAQAGSAREANSYLSEKTSTGKGLTLALKQIIETECPPWVLCDLNGEGYRAMEWGLVLNRMAATFDPLPRLDHPADCLGDSGAATGGLLLAGVAHAFGQGYHPADRALLWTAADDGKREALIVENFLGVTDGRIY